MLNQIFDDATSPRKIEKQKIGKSLKEKQEIESKDSGNRRHDAFLSLVLGGNFRKHDAVHGATYDIGGSKTNDASSHPTTQDIKHRSSVTRMAQLEVKPYWIRESLCEK